MIKKFFWLSSLGLIINLIIPLTVKANSGDIIINEIAWMGTATSANAEWIELYNTTDADIDLTDWTLTALDGTPNISLAGIIPAKGYFLLERTDDDSVPNVAANQIYTGALGNTGENLTLKNQSGDVIDTTDQSNGWLGGDNTTKHTLERVGTEISWSNSALPEGTPKTKNSDTINDDQTINQPTNNNSGGGGSLSTPTNNQYSAGDVLINEFISNPADGNQEWVELYNQTNNQIDLIGWYLEDGSGSKTLLSENLGITNTSKYRVIYEPKGNLNNAGDIILLKYQNEIIDQVTYGNWNDGNTNDNAPVTAEPESCGRIPNGTDTNNDANDWQKTTPTPNNPNSAEQEIEKNIQPNTIVINELYPNPPLGDLENEFIELTNLSHETIDLNGWQIKDGINNYIISNKDVVSTYLKPKEFLALYRPITGLVLNNTSAQKISLWSTNKITQEITYSVPALEGQSWSRLTNGDWSWATEPTPGQTYKINLPVLPPTISWEVPTNTIAGQLTIFDASDSFDIQKRVLSFQWNFGDGGESHTITPSHVYSQPGKYELTLIVTTPDGGVANKHTTITVKKTEQKLSYQGEILKLSEVMPNPIGSDTEEWLEIFNPQTKLVNLSNWKITTNHKTYNLPEETIPPESYYILSKKDLGFSLLNNGDQIKLISAGDYQDTVTYPEALEGWSWSKSDQGWQWTNVPTPQTENIIANQETELTIEPGETIELDEIKNLSSRTKVQTQGVIAVTPGTFGKDLFLAGSGLQINLQQGDWPDLKIGDVVIANGTVSNTVSYGTRLLIKNNNDINVIDQKETVPQGIILATEELTDNYEGWLITINGEVIKKDKNSFTIIDGAQSIVVVLKNNINYGPEVNVGQKIQLTGFLVINKGEYKLWPRGVEDIVIKESTTGRVAGVQDEATKPNDQTNWLGYAFIVTAAIIIIGGYWWEKKGKTWLEKYRHKTS